MTSKVAIAAAIVGGVFVAVQPTHARQQDRQAPTFRDRVEAVRIDATAIDHGRPILGLTADDFEVKDNGIVQHLDLATMADHVSIAIALDMHASEWPQLTPELVRAAEILVGALAPKDHAWLVAVTQTFALTATSSDRSALLSAIEHLRRGGGPNLWDAVFASSTLVAGYDGRAVVVVLSDGREPFARQGWLDENRALDLLKRGEVTVSAVQPRSVMVEPTDLERAARATGGEVFEAEHSDRLARQFSDLLDRFRLSYILTFTPTGVSRGDGWHKLSVRLTRHAGKVTAREGYVSGQ